MNENIPPCRYHSQGPDKEWGCHKPYHYPDVSCIYQRQYDGMYFPMCRAGPVRGLVELLNDKYESSIGRPITFVELACEIPTEYWCSDTAELLQIHARHEKYPLGTDEYWNYKLKVHVLLPPDSPCSLDRLLPKLDRWSIFSEVPIELARALHLI